MNSSQAEEDASNVLISMACSGPQARSEKRLSKGAPTQRCSCVAFLRTRWWTLGWSGGSHSIRQPRYRRVLSIASSRRRTLTAPTPHRSLTLDSPTWWRMLSRQPKDRDTIWTNCLARRDLPMRLTAASSAQGNSQFSRSAIDLDARCRTRFVRLQGGRGRPSPHGRFCTRSIPYETNGSVRS